MYTRSGHLSVSSLNDLHFLFLPDSTGCSQESNIGQKYLDGHPCLLEPG